jgi:hypothetical protein
VLGDGTLWWGCPVVRSSTSSGLEVIFAGQLLLATHFTMWALMHMSQRIIFVMIVLTKTQRSSMHDENM